MIDPASSVGRALALPIGRPGFDSQAGPFTTGVESNIWRHLHPMHLIGQNLVSLMATEYRGDTPCVRRGEECGSGVVRVGGGGN